MSTDTETSTSSASSADHKKRKSHKTHKRKSDKKHKKEKKQNRHKQKKRARHDSIKDETPVHTKPAVIAVAAPTEAYDYGPALPPHLMKDRPVIVGPVLPANFQQQLEAPAAKSGSEPEAESDGEAGIYGPVPVGNGENATVAMSSAQLELEQRALELKIAGIGGGAGNGAEQQEREEWMLELPQVGLKSGLAALANMKRTFHQGKERPDFSDRSAWTKTPQDAAKPTQPTTSKSAAESLKREAEVRYERQRDEEQERIAKKHKKKHKRDESLLEIHQKKLRKEQKRKEKELAASGAKPERRPFSRDVDLKLNKIDSNQTKQIVDKAKILNTKFASGQAKYL